MTNFLAILLAGGVVLAIPGLNSAALNTIKGTARLLNRMERTF
jgi:hypothetical protein